MIEKMELVPASKGAFEVSVNDQMIYSKLDTGVFPDTDEIIKQMEALN
ncbi:Rdx family protein [Mesobacillus subterraneus]|nr:Rdx family protein [Mesobacillus subterraneus]MCM3682138.1 Rdx family protein [Mesobacillus subterraneus]